jgi:hypothetical protein
MKIILFCGVLALLLTACNAVWIDKLNTDTQQDFTEGLETTPGSSNWLIEHKTNSP